VPEEPLKSCLWRDRRDPAEAAGTSSDSRLARKPSRAISVDRAFGTNDPMSVLPVCSTETYEQAEAAGGEASASSGRPALSIIPPSNPATQPISPSTARPARPGMFSSFKRPSFMKRNSDRSDQSLVSPGLAGGSSLKRWTSESSTTPLSPISATTPSSSTGLGDFDGPSGASRGYFSEHGRGMKVPPCIMEDQPLGSTIESNALKSNAGGGGKFMTLRPCCRQCQQATDKGLQEDWVPPISKRAQKKLDVEHMIRTIEGKTDVDQLSDQVDEKASSFLVDEVELLRRRRDSNTPASPNGKSETPDRREQTCSLGLRSPCLSKGPVWLCSGKGRSPSSSSVSRQSPAASPTVGQSPGDFFQSRLNQEESTSQTDLELKIAEALAAEAAMARASRRDTSIDDVQNECTSSDPSNRVEHRTDWFRGVVV